MAAWRIVCTKQSQVEQPTPHRHIVGVGTGDRPDWADMRWSLDQVLAVLEEGDVFYTQDAATGQVTLVEQGVCPYCHKTLLRSAQPAGPDPLDGLRSCSY
jgi:hypothetical protein